MLSSTVISENTEQCHSARVCWLRAFQEIFSQTNTIPANHQITCHTWVPESWGIVLTHSRWFSRNHRDMVEMTALPLNVIHENMILNKIILNKRSSKNIFFSFYQQLTSFGYSNESPFSPFFFYQAVFIHVKMFEENKLKSNPGVSELQGGGERRKTHFSRCLEDFTKSKTQPCLQLLYNKHGLRCTPTPPLQPQQSLILWETLMWLRK